MIAVNLQLAIMHNANTIGLTKWYILGCMVAAIASVLPSGT